MRTSVIRNSILMMSTALLWYGSLAGAPAKIVQIGPAPINANGIDSIVTPIIIDFPSGADIQCMTDIKGKIVENYTDSTDYSYFNCWVKILDKNELKSSGFIRSNSNRLLTQAHLLHYNTTNKSWYYKRELLSPEMGISAAITANYWDERNEYKPVVLPLETLYSNIELVCDKSMAHNCDKLYLENLLISLGLPTQQRVEIEQFAPFDGTGTPFGGGG